jgi:hypothetical protein
MTHVPERTLRQPRRQHVPTTTEPSRLTARASRLIEERAVLDATTLNAGAYVAFVAMSKIELITTEESRHVARHPFAEHRFRAIADVYSETAVAVLADFMLGR